MESSKVAKSYDAFYYATSCGRPYQRDEEWMRFFDSVATRIASDIAPATVLDAGCAMGFLVEALRSKGIEAFGIDISEYAIQRADASIRPFCSLGSLTDPLPRRYDLIVCIEVIEHMTPTEGEQAIENLCRHADDIILSTTPFDYKEVTHINVQSPDYWAERFARHGFFRDVEFDASFLTPWAIRFRRSTEPVWRIIGAYERQLWQKDKELVARRELTLEQRDQLSQKDQELLVLRTAATEASWQTMTSQVSFEERIINAVSERLGEQFEQVRTVMTQLSEKDKTIAGISDELQKREESIKSLREELTSALEKVNTLQVQLDSLDSKHRSLIDERDEKEYSIRSLKSREKGTQELIASLSHQKAAQGQELQRLSGMLAEREVRLTEIDRSMAWYVYNRLKYPYLLAVYRAYDRIKYPYLMPIYRRLGLAPKLDVAIQQSNGKALPALESPVDFSVPEIAPPPGLEPHKNPVDVIVCVHNALDDVRRCLESVVYRTRTPYTLIIVDDGSGDATRQYLESFAKSQGAVLVRNEHARGYTFAANQGLKLSKGDYAVLLNSDTIVTPQWLDRMVACAESDPSIGIVGPLSNTASWQSIPELQIGDDWAENKLPEEFSVPEFGKLVSDASTRLYPRFPFLNGFCLMISARVIKQIGYFDELNFGKGYGEENDYCLRAREAGWQLAVADDAYVYHAQSKSYSHERRKELSRQADIVLAAKHDPNFILEGVRICQADRVIEGIRARSRTLVDRKDLIEKAMATWEGKRVVFILSIRSACGGGNVVLDEVEAMRKMGVDARILNLRSNRDAFEQAYPANSIPVLYAESESRISELTSDEDAVIATYCASVYWMDSPIDNASKQVRGYYIQDFEPNFFDSDPHGFRMAWNSYTEHPDLVRFTKTEWNRDAVRANTLVESVVVGPSVNIDLFRPRRRHDPDWPTRPLRIAAMIRPSTPRRAARLTMEILRDFQRAHGDTVEIILFGCESADPDFLALPRDFAWRNAGMLTRPQLAYLLNEVDIFADFSEFQAMGLTAMEAMACGVAAIVPEKGGAKSFAVHDRNAIFVDTSSRESCLAALERLSMERELRLNLQRQSIHDICQYYPERAAFNTLEALFPSTTGPKD